MTNETHSFEEWFDFYREYSRSHGVMANFPDEWLEDYEAGKTPEEAYRDAWE